jgi:hypothetical protein
MSPPDPLPTAGSSGPPPRRRRRYLIDKQTQLRVLGTFLVAIVVMGGALVVVLQYFFGPSDTELLGAAQVRHLMLCIAWWFFGFATLVLAHLTISLTHRFVGPAYVFRQAMKGMLEGDFARRLTLRKKDFLKSVASDLAEVRARWTSREREVVEAVRRAETCLASGRVDEALTALAAVRESTPVRDESPVRDTARVEV